MQILHHSLDFNAFCMIGRCYSCLSNSTWSQLCWSFFFSKVAWLRVCNFFALTALDMVLNTSLSHKLSTQYYNTDVCQDPNDYRSIRPEMFYKKGVIRNFAKFTGKHFCQSLFFSKETLFKKLMTLVKVFSCAFCEISFILEHLWWLLL